MCWFGALMCPNSILGAQVTPIPIRMSLNSILNFELTAYEPQFDTWYGLGTHMSTISIPSIELVYICLPVWYQVSNWATWKLQFDAEYRIGKHMSANSILNIELGHLIALIRYSISNWGFQVPQIRTQHRELVHKQTTINDELSTVCTVQESYLESDRDSFFDDMVSTQSLV